MYLIIGVIIGAIAGVIIAITNKELGVTSGYSNQRRTKEQSGGSQSTGKDSDLSLGTKLMLGAMGSKLIDDQIEKHKQESEKRRYDSLNWQDSARDKNPNEDDDWL